MKRGTVSLYDYNGALLRSRIYPHVKARKEIIEQWQKEYRKNFSSCYIQIKPDVEQSLSVRKYNRAMLQD